MHEATPGNLLPCRRVPLATTVVLLRTAHDSPTPTSSTTNLPAVEYAHLRRATLPHGRGAHDLAAVRVLAKFADMFPLAPRRLPHLLPPTTSRCCCCCYRGVRAATPRDLKCPLPATHGMGAHVYISTVTLAAAVSPPYIPLDTVGVPTALFSP